MEHMMLTNVVTLVNVNPYFPLSSHQFMRLFYCSHYRMVKGYVSQILWTRISSNFIKSILINSILFGPKKAHLLPEELCLGANVPPVWHSSQTNNYQDETERHFPRLMGSRPACKGPWISLPCITWFRLEVTDRGQQTPECPCSPDIF